jgi:TolB-like protein
MNISTILGAPPQRRACAASPPPTASDASRSDADAAQAELQRILASPCFCKAQRSSRLLHYLVGQGSRGGLRLTNEYAIGLEVFGRDAATYNTGDDPIVRVQAGRLRDRLKAYYATDGRANPLRISIPLGGYTPRFEHFCVAEQSVARLAFEPFDCMQGDAAAIWFTAGLNEELRYRLSRQLGTRLASFPQQGQWRNEHLRNGISHVLEGSVRADSKTLRTCLRLLYVAKGGIVWIEQLDHEADWSIAHQEQLASLCCLAAQEYFIVGSQAAATLR